MLEQIQDNPKRVEPIFYFKFEMRLEFIPFIEQQIEEFIRFIENKINNIQNVPQILLILNKRIRDIDRFYDENWSDYRAQQILRSRQQLVQFCKRNHTKLSIRSQLIKSKNDITPNKQPIKQEIKPKQRANQSKISYEMIDSPTTKNQAINIQRIKHSTSKSIQRQNAKNVFTSNKTSPFIASPTLQSPSVELKYSPSRELSKESPIRGVKLKESPIQKKSAPRKLTKQEYIQHLRNKKGSQ